MDSTTKIDEATVLRVFKAQTGGKNVRNARIFIDRVCREMTLRSVGEKWGVSKERVRELQVRGMRLIRKDAQTEPMSRWVSISPRARNALRMIDVENARDLYLAHCNGFDFGKLPEVGRVTLNEIEREIANYSERLRGQKGERDKLHERHTT